MSYLRTATISHIYMYRSHHTHHMIASPVSITYMHVSIASHASIASHTCMQRLHHVHRSHRIHACIDRIICIDHITYTHASIASHVSITSYASIASHTRMHRSHHMYRSHHMTSITFCSDKGFRYVLKRRLRVN